MGRMKSERGVKCAGTVSVASRLVLFQSLSSPTYLPHLSTLRSHPSTNTHAPEYLAKYDDFKAKVRIQ